jgi:NAD(P)-dependent dehydrogenase (short-subunit alcohol dehydrogenase family)
MAPTIVFITGANRGLGLGLLQRYLAQPNHTVIAGNRNPAHPSSQALADLPKGDGSKLVVVKLDASVDQDAFSAVKELQDKHAIDHLDIVIANAGVSYAWPSVAELKLDDLRGHMSPNVYGFIALYQATRALMQKSSREPIFSPIGSSAGCIVCVSHSLFLFFFSVCILCAR